MTLLSEITVSKFSRNNLIHRNAEKKSSNIYKFEYRSACTDMKSALRQLNNLYSNLLNEDDLKITHWDASEIAIDDHFELSISLVLTLNNFRKLDETVYQFDVFTAYLDRMS